MNFFSIAAFTEAVYERVCDHQDGQKDYHQDEPQRHKIVIYFFLRNMPNHFNSYRLIVVSGQLTVTRGFLATIHLVLEYPKVGRLLQNAS